MLSTITAMSNSDLTKAISSAHRTLTIHKAQFILMVAQFHLRALSKKHGAPNTATWLMRTQDLSRRTALEYINVGNRLGEYPLLSAGFLSGDISYSKVRLLLRYLTSENEEELVALAKLHAYPELEQALSGRERTSKRKARNTLRVVIDEETGSLRYWGELDPDNAARFLASMKIGELANLRGLNGITPQDLEGEGVDKLLDAAKPDTPEQPSTTRFGVPMLDSMLHAFLGMINVVRCQPRSSVRAPGAQVNVLTTLDGRATLPGQPAAQSSDLIRSIVNGSQRYHLLDKDGLHLKLTRSARTVSSAQEVALLTLWGHQCATPGCNHTHFLEFHHIHEWSKGGLTNLDNLVPLCSGCHALVTSGAMTIVADDQAPSILRFRLPGGESFTSASRQLPIRDGAMGQWKDPYTYGKVPVGDEDLIPVWDHPESFDEFDEPDPLAEENPYQPAGKPT
ncbi:HNH endonuclease [Corynebacterium atrinae]|uniref:HNH endonuclease signature motif containing protein n=1 Tax=Corynebacterium atrinae TaxID=1336740 RepID=UPI0025B59359|nr:HNH endonuclease signature motif containing protein [Corynebacterium atrinae]WJY64633.1 HNH endonuclease [Corynebacterium atrinae]